MRNWDSGILRVISSHSLATISGVLDIWVLANRDLDSVRVISSSNVTLSLTIEVFSTLSSETEGRRHKLEKNRGNMCPPRESDPFTSLLLPSSCFRSFAVFTNDVILMKLMDWCARRDWGPETER